MKCLLCKINSKENKKITIISNYMYNALINILKLIVIVFIFVRYFKHILSI